MGYTRQAAASVAAAGLMAAALAAPGGASAPQSARAAACTPAGNIEAIVDDSGSMAVTDSNALRVRALKLLIGTLDAGTSLGAVEFGSSFDPALPSADSVFPPEPVGPNAAAMGAALDAKILADAGGTDYNAAFAQSDAANPNAQARVFLTDGGHNVGDYANGHLTHRVPTYVIGFSAASIDPTSGARLQTIATDTGGRYFAQTDSSQLQSVMNEIGAALACRRAPRRFLDALAQGQAKTHTVRIARTTRSLQITLTWPSPLDSFTVSGLRLVRNGRTIAVAARQRRRPRRLKVARTTNPTFTVLKISRLRPGRLRFRVRATRIGSGTPTVTLVTQVSGSRGR